ncbi:peptidylprolyl isomerase [Hyphobacterium sp. CCMP332]|nr:peptidylprolyl isomerase [Hyphobacterium sp. CCMP332]
MKYLQTKVILILVFAFSFNAKSQITESVVIDKILAKVDDHIILKSEMEVAYLQYLSSGQSLIGDAKCRVLESLIINKLLLAKAEIDSVTVSEDIVESNLDQRMQVFTSQFGSEKKLEEFYGKTIDEFKDEFRDQVRDQLIIERMDEKIASNLEASPKEVRKFFNQIPEDSLPFFSTEVVVGVLVRDINPGEGSKKSILGKMNSIRDQILNGTDFRVMAREYSQDFGNKEKGGELGYWKKSDLDPDYVAAAMKLDSGQVSPVVKTQFGYHLIQMVGKRGNEFNSRHILLRPNFSELDISYTLKEMDSIKQLILNDSMTFEKAAKEFSQDPYTKPNGGILVDQNTGSTKIPLERMDTELYFVLDTMEVGEISNPIVFTKPDGQRAMRIVYFKDKVAPHQANLQDDYQKIYQATLDEKRFEKKKEWFEKTKNQVFISIDDEYNQCKILQ